MRGKVKHAGRNGKHFYIYLGAQVVMEYLKLAYGQTRAEQTAKFQGNERRKTEVRSQLVYAQEFRFNYIVPWQNGNWFYKTALFYLGILFFRLLKQTYTFTERLLSYIAILRIVIIYIVISSGNKSIIV